MNDDDWKFLNLPRLPGTIDAVQAGILLGVPPGHVAILVSEDFLPALGGNLLSRNAPLRFSSAAISKLATDPEKMEKMHRVLSAYWRSRNGTNSLTNRVLKKGRT